MTSLFGSEYQKWIDGIVNAVGPVPMIFIILGISLLGGFAITRLCKLLKIPYVTGYIILGILLGPSLLAFIPQYLITGVSDVEISGIKIGYAGFSFISDMTMGFIAFGCGRYFKWSSIKAGGKKPLLASFLIAIAVGVIVGGLSYVFYGIVFNKANEYGLAPAFLFGACAACISPTATSSIIRQYKAKSHFVERTFQNILIANITAILAFSVILSLVSTGILGGYKPSTEVTAGMTAYIAFKPIISTILFCGVGVLFAWILSRLNNYKRTNDSRIILTISFTIILVAICSLPYTQFSKYLPITQISPLLPCMAFGIVYYNLSKSEALFLQLDSFLPPILCLFFVISGAKLDLRNFAYVDVTVVAVLFVIFRFAAQFGSSYGITSALGCSNNTRKYLSFTMLTMTSVAVGLINLAVSIIGDNEMIEFVYIVILTACVILEIIGPIFAKLALVKTDSVDPATLIKPTDPKLAHRNSGSVSEE